MAARKETSNALVQLVRWITAPENRPAVRKAVYYALASFGLLSTGGFLHDWRSKVPVTRGELDTAQAEIQMVALLAVAGYADRNDTTFARYQDSLGRKEQWYRDNVAVPALTTLEDLSQRIARIERSQGITNKRLEELPDAQRSALQQLEYQVGDLQRNGHYDDEMAQILKALSELQEKVKGIDARVNRRNKINL